MGMSVSKYPLGERPTHLWPALLLHNITDHFLTQFVLPTRAGVTKSVAFVCCVVGQTIQQVPYFIHVDLKVGHLQQEKTQITQERFQWKTQEKRKMLVGCNWLNNDIINCKILCPGSVEVLYILGTRALHYSDIDLILNHWILHTRCHNSSANSGGRRRTASFSAWLLTRHQFWDRIYFDIKVSPENKSQWEVFPPSHI